MHVIGIKQLLHNEEKTILYQNQTRPHHNTTYSKQKVGVSVQMRAHFTTVVPLQTAVHIGWPAEARIFAVDRSIFSICRWWSRIFLSSRNESRHHCFVCGISFHLYSLHFCIEKKWIAASQNGNFPFCRMRPGFYSSIFLELVCCSLLVIATIMADDPAPKSAEYGAHSAPCVRPVENILILLMVLISIERAAIS